jgi:hypothetical protein
MLTYPAVNNPAVFMHYYFLNQSEMFIDIFIYLNIFFTFLLVLIYLGNYYLLNKSAIIFFN